MKHVTFLAIMVIALLALGACNSAKNSDAASPAVSDSKEAPVQPSVEQKPLTSENGADANLTDTEKRVLALLSGVEKILSPKDFIDLDKKEAHEALKKFYKDTSKELFIRARALSALTLFSADEETATLIRASLADTKEPLALRRTAIKALAQTAKADSLSYLLPMLDDEDKFIREAVVLAVSDIKDERVQKAFKARLNIEKEDFLIQALKQNLTQGQPAEEVKEKK